jgi:hypothetical protein
VAGKLDGAVAEFFQRAGLQIGFRARIALEKRILDFSTRNDIVGVPGQGITPPALRFIQVTPGMCAMGALS